MTASPMGLMTDDEVAAFGRRDDAGFGALTCPRGALPLVAMDVDARVAGVIASIDVAQTFVNITGAPIEATYIFPLPDRAAVHRFRMEVAGRVVEGIVDERGAARATYDQAIAAGHRAAISEEERPGVFTLRVGNLLAGEAATVRISLVGPLPVDDGEVTFQFPLVVAPRYIPGAELGGDQAGLGAAADTNLVPDASRIAPPVKIAGLPNPVRLSIRVALADHAVHDVASSLHATATTHRDAMVIAIQPGEKLDRDFILRWRVAPGTGHALASTFTCSDDADGTGGTFMLTLVPPSTASLAAKPRDVVFVIDRSGSMGGWKMVAARRAAARMIDTLTSRDRFAAIVFDDKLDVLPDLGLSPATDRNRFRAVEGLAKVDARGGTELAEPLRHATDLLGAPTDARERVIVLVTDGQVGNEDDILRQLAPLLRGTRVFTLGIDQAVNAAFLRRLAGAGGGLCEVVESEERLDAVMHKVHRRIGTPVLTDLRLVPSGLAVDLSTCAPSKLPDVCAGAPVVILGRYRGRAAADHAMVVSGAHMGEAYEQRVVREPDGIRGGGWLGASWARARIRDLEDRYAAGQTYQEQPIIAVSKQFRVLSRFTAFVAVDGTEVVNSGGRVTAIVQPVETPAGWAPTLGAGPAEAGKLSVRSSSPRASVKRSADPVSSSFAGPSAPAGGPPASMKRPPSAPAPAPAPASASAPARARKAEASPPPPQSPAASKMVMRAAAPHQAGTAPEGPSEAFLTRLTALATALAAQGRGANDAAAIRLIRMRLLEWIEDVRSVGGQEAIAGAVEALVAQVTAAVASGEVSAVLAAADALANLGAVTPAAAPPTGRVAFWK